MSAITLSYIDKLQRANVDDLAFYPLTTLEKALDTGHIVTCEDNGEAAGYLWFGALRGGHDVTIYQACVDYKRGRDLNCYRTDIQPGLFVLPGVVPSERPIDLTAYNRQKRLGVSMPSRFSRTHYGIDS
jgi:hypothetical protein